MGILEGKKKQTGTEKLFEVTIIDTFSKINDKQPNHITRILREQIAYDKQKQNKTNNTTWVFHIQIAENQIQRENS